MPLENIVEEVRVSKCGDNRPGVQRTHTCVYARARAFVCAMVVVVVGKGEACSVDMYGGRR